MNAAPLLGQGQSEHRWRGLHLRAALDSTREGGAAPVRGGVRAGPLGLSGSPSPQSAPGGAAARSPRVSCFCPDTSARVSEPLRSTFPDTHSDSASKELPGRLLLDIDNDTESTAL